MKTPVVENCACLLLTREHSNPDTSHHERILAMDPNYGLGSLLVIAALIEPTLVIS
ncbi:MAG: hypothetical protein JNJ95_11925 [Dechloromonas sp.]|nr:hypothetical protein [Dechloromonas sp.]